MLKITLDTNILISATITDGNEFQLLKKIKEGKADLILSPYILKEFKEVISRPKFGFSHEQIEQSLKQLLTLSTLIMPLKKLTVVKEYPDDNMIIECAVAGTVDYIVSGDKHLLELKEYRGIKIVKTTEILVVL